MNQVSPSKRLRPTGLVLAALLVALLAAACVPTGTAPTPLSTAAPVPAQPAAAPTTGSQPALAPVQPLDLPAGVDADGNFYRGDPKATVKLVEFSDFQCPYCLRHIQQTSPQIDATYVATGQVLHVFRHFPLTAIHPNALPAAKASYCAGQQSPDLFWQMHDWLFANQETWSAAQDAAAQFRAQALALKADAAQYDTCVADAATEARIQRDMQEGAALGVSGTPGFFINNWFINGAYPFTEFQDKIGKAQQGLEPAPTPTPLPTGSDFFDADPARPGYTYDGSPTLGAADAPLALIAFADFKCGYCARHATTVEPALRAKYVDAGQVRVVFEFFPIYAPKAAVASMCAADQGQFWAFHDLLFSKQAEWKDGDEAKMAEYAASLGLDEAQFNLCLKDAPGQSHIETAYQLGQELGVRATPTFLLIDTRQTQSYRSIVGAAAQADFDAKIQELLNPATPTGAP